MPQVGLQGASTGAPTWQVAIHEPVDAVLQVALLKRGCSWGSCKRAGFVWVQYGKLHAEAR